MIVCGGALRMGAGMGGGVDLLEQTDGDVGVELSDGLLLATTAAGFRRAPDCRTGAQLAVCRKCLRSSASDHRCLGWRSDQLPRVMTTAVPNPKKATVTMPMTRSGNEWSRYPILI